MAIGLGASSGNRIMEGGTGQRLRAPTIDVLIAAREASRDWMTYNYNGDQNVDTGALAVGEDPVWEITSGADADVGLDILGPGLRLDTTANDGDQVIISADQGTAIQGDAAFWDSDLQPGVYATIVVNTEAAGLHNSRIFVALRATSTDDIVTDNDKGMLVLDANGSDVRVPWSMVTSVGGVDFVVPLSGAQAVSVAVGVGVLLDSARRPNYFLNGNWVGTGPAVAANVTTMIPRVGVASRGGDTQKIIDIRNIWICQRYQA